MFRTVLLPPATLERIGYLYDLKRASESTVAIATHNRAIYTGLGTLSTGREFISIHEDSLNVLRPDCTVKVSDYFLEPMCDLGLQGS